MIFLFRRIPPLVWAVVLVGAVTNANAAVRCTMRTGQGCNGPVVYEIQLCAVVTFNQGQCEDLCRANKPICNVSDFDSWISSYDRRGRDGFKGELAESTKPDDYDLNGQITATSGQTYTVCESRKASLLSGWSNPSPVSGSVSCPQVFAASEENCVAGTVFNKDPINPKCVTNDSYCSGGGSSGNFATTMSVGFQMVAVQNQHFIEHPGEDSSGVQNAATAGSTLAGLIAPVGAAAQVGNKNASAFVSSNSSGRGSASAVGSAGAGSTLAATGEGVGSSGLENKDGLTAELGYGAKKLALVSESALGESSGSANSAGGEKPSTGASWFGSGNSSATAGSAGAELGFSGEGSAASRGIASDGRLAVEDPENYFMLSDVDVSLFKRVTAQCRKKELSLVLAP